MTAVEQPPDLDPSWPCLRSMCSGAEDCRGGSACGWVGEDEPEPEPWDPQPIRAEEIPDDLVAAEPEEYRRTPLSLDEQQQRADHFAAARRVHVAPLPSMFERLGGGFDPRGRHVGCDGEPGPAGVPVGGCGMAPGLACRPPRGRFVPGFVHPSRLASERMLFGLDPA